MKVVAIFPRFCNLLYSRAKRIDLSRLLLQRTMRQVSVPTKCLSCKYCMFNHNCQNLYIFFITASQNILVLFIKRHRRKRNSNNFTVFMKNYHLCTIFRTFIRITAEHCCYLFLYLNSCTKYENKILSCTYILESKDTVLYQLSLVIKYFIKT